MTEKKFRTEQEVFWAGEFGNEYISRNTPEKLLATNIALFSRILSRANDITSIIELGANIGLNLEAIKVLLPEAKLSAVEINKTACDQLRERIQNVDVKHSSILELETVDKSDLALIKGVLIHINPDELETVYDRLAKAAARYVVIAEYYNPSPVSINYRGYENRLFKRNFAGEFMDRHTEFRVIDYGFVWHRDPNFPQDDITWFLMEKRELTS
jgi:pseudaminic acid biosynthesis-associated methylase